MLVYTASVFSNCGNYKSNGHIKFVPELEFKKFKVIARSSENYERYGKLIETILAKIGNKIYDEKNKTRIGFNDEKHG